MAGNFSIIFLSISEACVGWVLAKLSLKSCHLKQIAVIQTILLRNIVICYSRSAIWPRTGISMSPRSWKSTWPRLGLNIISVLAERKPIWRQNLKTHVSPMSIALILASSQIIICYKSDRQQRVFLLRISITLSRGHPLFNSQVSSRSNQKHINLIL